MANSIISFGAIVDIDWTQIGDYMSRGEGDWFISHCDWPNKGSVCDERVPADAGEFSRTAMTDCQNLDFNENVDLALRIKNSAESAGLTSVTVRAFSSPGDGPSRPCVFHMNLVSRIQEDNLWLEMICFVHEGNWLFALDNDGHIHVHSNTFDYYSSDGGFDGFGIDRENESAHTLASAALTAFGDYVHEPNE